MYKPHNHCRACGYGIPKVPAYIKADPNPKKLVEVLDLGLQPPANDFCKDNDERAGFVPLKVLFCPICQLAQLSIVVKPEVLYRHYAYVTSKSQTMRTHFHQLWDFIKAECNPESVIEIGSNDGDFLARRSANRNLDSG